MCNHSPFIYFFRSLQLSVLPPKYGAPSKYTNSALTQIDILFYYIYIAGPYPDQNPGGGGGGQYFFINIFVTIFCTNNKQFFFIFFYKSENLRRATASLPPLDWILFRRTKRNFIPPIANLNYNQNIYCFHFTLARGEILSENK